MWRTSDSLILSPSLASHMVSASSSSSSSVMQTSSLQDSFKALKGLSESDIRAFWKRKILSFPSSIPAYQELDTLSSSTTAGGSLVRFRGMIQDSMETELYPIEMRYQDTYSSLDEDNVLEMNDNPVLKERWLYYVVSIPGETDWVTRAVKGNMEPIPSGSIQKIRSKRHLEDNKERRDDSNPMEEGEEKMDAPENKKLKLAVHEGKDANSSLPTTSPLSWSLNFPITTQPGACSILAKIYGDTTPDLILNEPIDLYGILSTHQEDSDQGDEFASGKFPPPSVVPRFHVLHYTKLEHINPLLPPNLSFPYPELNLGTLREEILDTFSHLLFGDRLSAEYFLCHLASRVYGSRRDATSCLGKYSLNLSNVPLVASYTSRLASFLGSLLTSLHYLPLTIQNLNTLTLVPRKDYEANRLVAGMLQLSPGTHLILDETQLDTGKLSADGLKNLTALGNIINWQKVEYNFNFYPMEFSTDVPCLILSEGRSILPSDVFIPLKPNHATSHAVIEEKFKALQGGLLSDEKLLNKFRMFMTIIKNIPYDISDDIQESIQDDFVNERKRDPSHSPEDLGNRLILARLFSLTHGNMTLTPEVWSRVKSMEQERQARVAALPSRQASAIGQSGIPAKL
eukprot:TRINITY_DN5267_c0_g1_i1.p1 TRINITY_DN5267_c0_g1~~TRINITY_DN5267_c0_g1_i1.p1  ORF type:complete len:627 (-),score=197.35 TRINITY_DN5267_c0_g1_i1:48-1928(-)